MALDIPTITLDTTAGRPKVEVIFGHGNVGNYRCFRWDPAGQNPTQMSHGNNVDDVLDVFEIDQDPDALGSAIFSYEAIIQAPEAREGQLYSLTILVRQQGEVCKDGVIQHTGTFTDAKSVIGFRRFAV